MAPHTGRLEEAVTQFQALLEDRLRVLGPDHPDTLATRHNLADWLGEANRPPSSGSVS
jgi:Tetratricopeptide repeat